MKEEISVDEQVIAAIFIKYEQAKRVLENSNFLKESSTIYSNMKMQHQDLENYQKHVQIVDTVLALMPKNEYGYLIRTFLVCSNKNWWKKYYHRQEYELLQKKAIKRFLYLYLI